ncbi:MAG: DUF4330 domain-containing protein [Clostridia bacterium]|nr:DUF4330 domain-containing protein [Clostridia bacterium]
MKKFGIVDVIIILLVVVLCIAGYSIISGKEVESSKGVSDVEFTVEIKQLTQEEAAVIKVGDEITDSVKGGYYGKVVDVETKKATEIAANTIDGTYSVEEYPDKYDVYVTIHGTPTSMNESNIQFAGQKVKIGCAAYLKSDNYVGSGYIVALDIKE